MNYIVYDYQGIYVKDYKFRDIGKIIFMFYAFKVWDWSNFKIELRSVENEHN
jgi:hypothetical protein